MNCEMRKECSAPVTHIGSKGYIYCERHAIDRRRSGYEHTRRMRAWEVRWIEAGKQLPSYAPAAKAAAKAVQQ